MKELRGALENLRVLRLPWVHLPFDWWFSFVVFVAFKLDLVQIRGPFWVPASSKHRSLPKTLCFKRSLRDQVFADPPPLPKKKASVFPVYVKQRQCGTNSKVQQPRYPINKFRSALGCFEVTSGGLSKAAASRQRAHRAAAARAQQHRAPARLDSDMDGGIFPRSVRQIVHKTHGRRKGVAWLWWTRTMGTSQFPSAWPL